MPSFNVAGWAGAQYWVDCLKYNVQSVFTEANKRLVMSWIHFNSGLPRVREKSGKNKIFSRSGNCQGILKKCQGILAIWPMSGKCQGILSWQLIFFWTWLAFFCLHTFSSPKFFVSLASLNIYSHQTFFKMLYYFYEYCFILLLSGKNI